ncbi:unnamed protein product [Calicophoron daubneyi]|uniref:LNS2/PITP domain-containing protein n=1 Tax=Calicophoron daubneyi TaxID=300641 RepID=A0AAV2TIE2_CALDB
MVSKDHTPVTPTKRSMEHLDANIHQSTTLDSFEQPTVLQDINISEPSEDLFQMDECAIPQNSGNAASNCPSSVKASETELKRQAHCVRIKMLRALIKHLQLEKNWPKSFYLYLVTHKQARHDSLEQSPLSSPEVDDSALSSISSPEETTRFACPNTHFGNQLELMSNEDVVFGVDSQLPRDQEQVLFTYQSVEASHLRRFSLRTDELECLWVEWDGQLMSAITAAYCLLTNISEDQKQTLLARDRMRKEYNFLAGARTNFSSPNRNGLPTDSKGFHTEAREVQNKNEPLAHAVDDRTLSNELADFKNDTNTAVQALLPPISLPLWSPTYIQSDPEDDEKEEEGIKSEAEKCTLRSISQPMRNSSEPVEVSADTILTPEPESISSPPEEPGYFSDDNDGGPNNTSVHERRSSRIDRRLSMQGSYYMTSEQLSSLNLHDGVNEAVFSVVTKYQGTCQCACFVYLWNWTEKVVISDIDGTITRSDWLGQLMPLVGFDWTHSNIVRLYNRISQNGYHFVYLSSRAIGQARTTRNFLHNVQQEDAHLPDGPILLAPFSILKAFHREVIQRKAEEFKISCLQELRQLFPNNFSEDEEERSLVAGFGNRLSDITTYKAVGLTGRQIFTVNYLGQVVCGDLEAKNDADKKRKRNKKLEKRDEQEIVNENQADVHITNLTYDSLCDMVHLYFPQSHDRLVHATDYSDFTFWRM